MEHYKIKSHDVAQACINSIKQHPWYHDQRTVIFFLADEELLPEVRESVAKKLFNSESQGDISKSKDPQQYKDSYTPNLASFVGGKSWLVFKNLGFTMNNLEWYQVSCKDWEKFSSYRRFKESVYKLHILNDPAESAVRFLFKTT